MQPQPQPPSPSVPEPKAKIKVIDSLKTFFIATAVLGPFALPLLWRNPRFKWTTKVWGSVAVLLFTWGLLVFTEKVIKAELELWYDFMEKAQQARQAQ